MLSTAKIYNSYLLTNDQSLSRPTSIPLGLNSQQMYHHTPSPTNTSNGLSISSQVRSFPSMNCRFCIEQKAMRVLPRLSLTSSIVEDGMMTIYIDRQREKEGEERVCAYVINIEHKNKNGGRERKKECVHASSRVRGIVIAAVEENGRARARERREKKYSRKNRKSKRARKIEICLHVHHRKLVFLTKQ